MYLAMAWNLDKSVGSVVNALKEENMLDNSIIVFASDNGAQTRSFAYQNDGSNYPFRGVRLKKH
jgi:arylsulfatase B